MNHDSSLHDEAAGWALERADGLSPTRAAELQAWLQRDPRHAAALREAELTCGLLGQLPAVAPERPARRARRAPLIAFASGALGLAAAVAFLVSRPAPPAVAETFQVAASQQPVQTRLSDGSVVRLNTEGVAAIELSASHRRVRLQGEGHFQVAPEPGRPFTVEAAGWMVTAIGTAFTVSADAAGDLTVIVTEGVVAIDRPGQAQPARKVAAGEVARGTRQAEVVQVAPARAEELHSEASWQAKIETFNDVTLGELVDRFNRTGRLRFVIADDALRQRKVGGTFSLQNADVFLSLIQQDGSIVAERISADEVRLRAARP